MYIDAYHASDGQYASYVHVYVLEPQIKKMNTYTKVASLLTIRTRGQTNIIESWWVMCC